MMRLDVQGFQIRLEFIQQPEGFIIRRPNPTSHTVFSGICQFQFWVDDIDALYNKVVERGDIDISWGPIDVGQGLRMKHLFIRDPEENIVLISQPY
jgi:predicted enzyme related to lactoylglutathione lyase